jgi:hypothetical protein
MRQAEMISGEFRSIWWTLGRQDAEISALKAAVANQHTHKASALGALPWLRIIRVGLYLVGWILVLTGHMSLATLQKWFGLLGGH